MRRYALQFLQPPHRTRLILGPSGHGTNLAILGGMPIKSFRDLVVWQASMDLADVCFDIVEAIPPNIAEGSQRPTKAYLNHLCYSLGAHAELETLFELLRRLKLVVSTLLERGISSAEPVGKMLHGLVESLEERLKQGSKS